MNKTQLGKTFRIISDKMIKILNKELKDKNLSSTQGLALICLNDEKTKELPIKTIEKILSTSQPNTLGIVNRLEQKELVKTHITQQRTKVVQITDKGLSNVQTIELYMEEVDKQVLYGFTDDEKELFLDFLKRAENNLSNIDITKK